MKKGGKHNWSYKGHWFERKVGRGKWIGTFRATKSQRPYRGVGKGSYFKWYLRGTQTAYKTKSGQYQTKYRFTKSLIKARPKKLKGSNKYKK